MPRSLLGSSSFASIAFRNLGTNLCMKLVTLTEGELCSWLIHSSSTIGASCSVQVSNLLQTESIKASSLNGILTREITGSGVTYLELRQPRTVSLILSSTFLA